MLPRIAADTLCHSLQRHDRQMLAATMVVEVDRESISRLASNKRLRPRASRRTRPALTSFDAWSSVSRSLTEVNFIRRSAIERCMRAPFVVPVDERKKLATACFSLRRYQNSSRVLVLYASDQTLDHGDAAMLADGTVSRRLDAFAFDPTTKRVAIEDAVPVTDDVFWRRVGTTDRPSQEDAHGTTVWPVGNDADVDNSAREMVDDDSDPPTKRPALRQSERQPRCPEP